MTINCRGHLLDLTEPVVMGILNSTPDSFFDGGKYQVEDQIRFRAEQILTQGGLIIDIGGYSSRPGATPVSEEEELYRVRKAVQVVVRNFPDAIISVDTFRASVATAAILEGAAMINDISAGMLDPQMIPEVARLQVPYIMMHMRGTSATMSELTRYDHLTEEIVRYFSERIAYARSLGISDLIIDPGFGFAKTLEQNFELLNKLADFALLNLPILVGVSRKSMIYKLLNSSPSEALNGTSALHMAALERGASILRVHDVKEAEECITLFRKLYNRY